MTKTNAMRLLEQAKITYQTSQYDYSEEDLSGVHAAEVLGFDPAMVFKTLVTRGDKTGPVVFVIPVAQELDLKKAAKVSGNKSVAMVHVKELLVLTGYIRGGCSPIGMKKKFPTYVDESALDQTIISISAGMRGKQILLAPQDLLAYLGAKTADLTQKETGNE
ncbi:MAG TPA: Cys-tRNA(Pro) deacylase [Firmicutes bacterium]|nr:Cys-tRNA(Pro) deacylase [Bacillota bacterium]